MEMMLIRLLNARAFMMSVARKPVAPQVFFCAMKRSRFADTLLPEVAHGLNVGGLAVPSVELEVTKDGGEPCNTHLTMVKGRNTNLRWLETALNVKIRSLFSGTCPWPLLEDIDKAKEAVFGKKTRYSARNTVDGKHLPTSALFSVQARGFELNIHAPRRAP